jgi:hypothetical protein
VNRKWRLKKQIVGAKRDPITRERDPRKDPEHLAHLHMLPCAVVTHPLAGATRCDGPIEAHHSTHGRGKSQKTNDRHAMPLCRGHHGEFHRAGGTFRLWLRERRNEWQDLMVAFYSKG